MEYPKERYRVWGGQPRGVAYDPELCAEDVQDGGRSPLSHQCCRKNGFGDRGLFCKQHAKWHPAKPDEQEV